jgi:molybdopterin molybdotransferase
MPGEEPRADQIIASNAFALKAMVEAEGAEGRLLPIAKDTEAELFAVLMMAEGADLIVTIGGASVGDHDLVGRVASSIGLDRAFWKIAMRPGKPLMAGRLHGVPMLGLPGNPVSAIVCGHLFLLPMVRAMLGMTDVAPRTLSARLAVDVAENGPRVHYMRSRLAPSPEGLPGITPFERQDSALLTILTEADALLIRPIGAPALTASEVVTYLPI